MAKLFEGARQNKKFVAKFILFALIFWLLQFSFQYYFAVPNEPESSLFKGAGNLLQTSLVRSLAFSGATFFAIALLLSSFFRWKPNYAKYWHVRRSFGVMGFVFIFFHSPQSPSPTKKGHHACSMTLSHLFACKNRQA